jgi:hypothetical protein
MEPLPRLTAPAETLNEALLSVPAATLSDALVAPRAKVLLTTTVPALIVVPPV